MGFVKGLIGAAGGAGGTGFAGPQKADIIPGANLDQANQAYGQTQTGLQQQQAFLNALAAQNGIGNQTDVYNQLANVAAGQGPNPAQAQLAQATAANTANQAALMASARGAASNPALIARLAAQQGAANQQNAAGQAATLGAQQQLGAINTMGNIAGQQVGNYGQAVQGYNQAAQGQQQNIQNALANQNSAAAGSQSSINAANSGMAQQRLAGQASLLGNLTGAVGGALGLAEGGVVPPAAAPSGPRSHVGKFLMAKGGKVPALVSPGEVYLPPEKVEQAAKGASALDIGEKIPGKAKVPGAKNSYANDTVPAALDEGGIVIPRSITQGKDPEKKAMEFVRAVLAKQGPKKA